MSTLCISMLESPLRASVQFADGARLRLTKVDEAADDSSVLHPLVYIDREGVEFGRQAQFLVNTGLAGDVWMAKPSEINSFKLAVSENVVWKGEEIFSLLIQRFLNAAKAQFGVDIYRVILIVGADLDQDARLSLERSGYMAGAARVEILNEGELVVSANAVESLEVHVLIGFSENQLHVSLFRFNEGVIALEETCDLSASYSGEAIAKRVIDSFEFEPLVRDAARTFFMESFPDWTSGAPLEQAFAQETGAPARMFLLPRTREMIKTAIAEQVLAIVTLANMTAEQINCVQLYGHWTKCVEDVISDLFPHSRTHCAEDGSPAFELAVPELLKRSTSQTIILASPPDDNRISHLQDSPSDTLIQAGQQLPISYIDDSFPTGSYFEEIGLYAASAVSSGDRQLIARLPLPRIFEKRPFSRLSLKILADNERYLFGLIGLGQDGLSRAFLWDRRRGEEARLISQHLFDSLFDKLSLSAGRPRARISN